MKIFLSSRLFSVILLITIPASVYFLNIEIQSYLGRKALRETGLASTPFEAAVGKARSQQKLVLVDVSAIWCSTCRKLDREVLADKDVKAVIESDFVFSRLEYESEEGRAFLDSRDADGIPNLWVVDGEGRTVTRLNVTFDPKEFKAQLLSAAAHSP